MDHVVLFLHVFDPLRSLELRIDHHWVLESVLDQKRIGDGDIVFRKAEVDPVRNEQVVTKDFLESVRLVDL